MSCIEFDPDELCRPGSARWSRMRVLNRAWHEAGNVTEPQRCVMNIMDRICPTHGVIVKTIYEKPPADVVFPHGNLHRMQTMLNVNLQSVSVSTRCVRCC